MPYTNIVRFVVLSFCHNTRLWQADRRTKLRPLRPRFTLLRAVNHTERRQAWKQWRQLGNLPVYIAERCSPVMVQEIRRSPVYHRLCDRLLLEMASVVTRCLYANMPQISYRFTDTIHVSVSRFVSIKRLAAVDSLTVLSCYVTFGSKTSRINVYAISWFVVERAWWNTIPQSFSKGKDVTQNSRPIRRSSKRPIGVFTTDLQREITWTYE